MWILKKQINDTCIAKQEAIEPIGKLWAFGVLKSYSGGPKGLLFGKIRNRIKNLDSAVHYELGKFRIAWGPEGLREWLIRKVMF